MSTKNKKRSTEVFNGKKEIRKQLQKLLEHCDFYNSMAPFPVYDTEYVEGIRLKIKEMAQSKEDYNKEPVTFCRHCKSLFIEIDEKDNDVCGRCGAVNEINILDIKEYTKKYGNIWDTK